MSKSVVIEFTVISNDWFELYRRYIRIVMVIKDIKLADLEVDILTAISQQEYKFTEKSRKYVCDALGMSKDHLNNYLKKLRGKQIINEDNEVMEDLRKFKFNYNNLNSITVNLKPTLN